MALGLSKPLLRALEAENYQHPTPIQAQAIPSLLDGCDLLGIAQTGTGKTAAFALPLLQHLSEEPDTSHGAKGARPIRALILAPTRELAVQIGDSVRSYGRHLGLRHTVLLGGVNQQPQVRALHRGVDILIATPGRLLDLANQGHVRLGNVSILVLDEADRMLDMGFVRDVRKIVAKLPEERQSVLFSATMPKTVERLAQEILFEPERVEVTPEVVTVERIEQHVYPVEARTKTALLLELLEDPALTRTIVFTRTKHGANRLAGQLEKAGVRTEAIHGNKSQSARQKALDSFRNGRARVLVATDVASRGIDVDNVTHVVNYELPNVPEDYVHRIGRTARAGAAGIALSFCDASERGHLRSIEKLIKRAISVATARTSQSAEVLVIKPGAKPGAKPGGRNGRKRRYQNKGGGMRRAA
jgi:ATP-dependent RNA helicase RhlE